MARNSIDCVIGDGAPDSRRPETSDAARPWLGVYFDCCGIYARIYRNKNAAAYVGACPRCRRTLRVPIGPSGTPQRIFRAK